jgi:hypothetical protein
MGGLSGYHFKATRCARGAFRSIQAAPAFIAGCLGICIRLPSGRSSDSRS